MDNSSDNTFQVSVKGLFFKHDKVMLMQEEDGRWEPPGGRVQKGEDLIDCLRRECEEEIGIACEVLDDRPMIVYSTIDHKGRPRIMMYYKIHLPHTSFTPSNECIAIDFFTKEEIKALNKMPQIERLTDFL